MKIIHGEQESESYKHLIKITAKDHHVSLDASTLNLTDLRQQLDSVDLFGNSESLVIGNLFSLPKSKKKESILNLLSQYQNKNHILYSNKKISATDLKIFTKSEVIVFDPPQVIFNFLDSLTPGNYARSKKLLDEVLRYQEIDFVYYMLMGHIKKIVLYLDNPDALKLSPFPKQKLAKQAKMYSLQLAVACMNKLIDLDIKRKQGRLPVSFEESLSLFLLELSFS